MIINPYKYLFGVMEGVDGCGKDTLMTGLCQYFLKNKGRFNFYFKYTREPVEDDNDLHEKKIRQILGNNGRCENGKKVTNFELQTLFIKNRLYHRYLEKKWLKHRGVLSNRDWEATFAYHMAFGGNPQWVIDTHEKIFKASKIKTDFFVPDLTLIIDIMAEESMKRKKSFCEENNKKPDYFENKKEKVEKIRDAYLSLPEVLKKLLPQIPFNIKIVDGMRSKKEVLKEVIVHVEEAIEKKMKGK